MREPVRDREFEINDVADQIKVANLRLNLYTNSKVSKRYGQYKQKNKKNMASRRRMLVKMPM